MSQPRQPNIILILTDDHAAHAISAYGSVVNETPRIDEIADGGARLDNCFATNALCSPSRASILTGTYSHVNGVTTLVTPMDSAQPTFISELHDAGYKTAIVGKWHLGHGEGHDPRNFDYWDVVIGQGEYVNPVFLSAEGSRTVEGYATNVITDLALEWLETVQDGDAPWCICIYHKAPHRPWEPDPDRAGMHQDPIPVPSTFDDDYATRTASARRAMLRIAEQMSLGDLKQTPPDGLDYEQLALWKYQRFMEDYLDCVSSVDDNVGRVIDWLNERHLFDDTLLMYSSDQGFFLGDHGWFDKRLMYEESLRMPFVASYPRGIAAGTVLRETVTNVDIAQTILDAAGIPHHPRMQGRSFWAELCGTEPAVPPAEGMYYRYWENGDVWTNAPAHYGFRTERYKLIYFYNDGMGLPGTGPFVYPPEWELYDMELDPDELVNVYDDDRYHDIREGLKLQLRQAQLAVGDEPHHSQSHPVGP